MYLLFLYLPTMGVPPIAHQCAAAGQTSRRRQSQLSPALRASPLCLLCSRRRSFQSHAFLRWAELHLPPVAHQYFTCVFGCNSAVLSQLCSLLMGHFRLPLSTFQGVDRVLSSVESRIQDQQWFCSDHSLEGELQLQVHTLHVRVEEVCPSENSPPEPSLFWS